MNIKGKIGYSILGFLMGNALLLAIFFGINHLNEPQIKTNDIDLGQGMTLIKSGKIKSVSIDEEEYKLTDSDNSEYFIKTQSPSATHELILDVVKLHNLTSKNQISLTIEQKKINWKWILLLNFPLILIISFGLIIIGLLFGIFMKLSKNKSLD